MKVTLTDGTTMEMSVEEYEVFAKITKTTEASEEEADTPEYDGVTYRKVCEKAAGETEEKAEAEANELQVGDFAEVLEGGNGFSRKGDVVSIAEKDSATVLYKIKHLNGKFAGWKTADGLRKIPVTYYEGKPYREVDRRAEKGELIKVVSAELAFGTYEDGDVLTAEKPVGNSLFARNSAGKKAELRHKEYVVLEPLEPAEEAPKSPFKIGDIVRGKPGQNRYLITNEDVERARVVHIHEDGNIGVEIQKHRTRKYAEGETFCGLEPEYFEKVKEESTEIDEGDALKVGDYAEVISKEEFFRTEFKVGDIVRLVEDDGSYIIRFERLSDGLRDWMNKRKVRKIDVTEYNGKKYVEVKRKAREGELIKIVNASTTFGEYGNGDVLVVKDVEQNAEHGVYGVDAEAIEIFILHEEYVVLEPIGTHKTEAIVKFADGRKRVFRDVESVELSTE